MVAVFRWRWTRGSCWLQHRPQAKATVTTPWYRLKRRAQIARRQRRSTSLAQNGRHDQMLRAGPRQVTETPASKKDAADHGNRRARSGCCAAVSAGSSHPTMRGLILRLPRVRFQTSAATSSEPAPGPFVVRQRRCSWRSQAGGQPVTRGALPLRLLPVRSVSFERFHRLFRPAAGQPQATPRADEHHCRRGWG